MKQKYVKPPVLKTAGPSHWHILNWLVGEDLNPRLHQNMFAHKDIINHKKDHAPKYTKDNK